MAEIFEKIILTFKENSEFYSQVPKDKLTASNLINICYSQFSADFPGYFNIGKIKGN